jgi:hypothetical protein
VLTDRGQPAVVRVPGFGGGRVVRLGGPWRLSAEWWTDDETNEDLYDAELSDGGIYVLGMDRRTGAWRLWGLYD